METREAFFYGVAAGCLISFFGVLFALVCARFFGVCREPEATASSVAASTLENDQLAASVYSWSILRKHTTPNAHDTNLKGS